MKYPEETRIFKLYLSASPPEGGTVTIELTDETQGEYLWGEVVSIKAISPHSYSPVVNSVVSRVTVPPSDGMALVVTVKILVSSSLLQEISIIKNKKSSFFKIY